MPDFPVQHDASQTEFDNIGNSVIEQPIEKQFQLPIDGFSEEGLAGSVVACQQWLTFTPNASTNDVPLEGNLYWGSILLANFAGLAVHGVNRGALIEYTLTVDAPPHGSNQWKFTVSMRFDFGSGATVYQQTFNQISAAALDDGNLKLTLQRASGTTDISFLLGETIYRADNTNVVA